ncbi:cation-translocating P-type ATPase [Thalassoglobus sp. JC818]|uniref:heavy metal translocating P-type ATPase n=1 Tax=Thalassoglobus sp. JC818 TaxID=3232136 RepID=UPI00345B07D7
MLTKLGIAIFLSMNVMVMTLALWAYHGDHISETPPMAEALSDVFRFACLLLSFPVLLLLGRPMLEQSIVDLKQRRLSTEILILSGVLSSFAYSTISVWRGTGDIYFEVGCMILVFVTLGRWLEAAGKLHSTQALDELQSLLPDDVIIRQRDLSERLIPRAELEIGDEVLIRAGERIPVDGVIVDGQTSVDEQLVTGESWPVSRGVQDRAVGGTISLDGQIIVQVDVAEDGTVLQRLIKAVQETRFAQSDTQRLADRISQAFIPATFCLALGTLLFHSLSDSPMTGLLAALSVVLIACPCGLGLATPMALWAAIGVAARRGIAFNSPQVLEALATIKAIRFDKTGTLTTGTPVVKSLLLDGQTSIGDVHCRSRQLAQSSTHVFSRAIQSYIPNHFPPLDVHPTSQAGKGVFGTVAGEFQPTALGSLSLISDLNIQCDPSLQTEVKQAEKQGFPIALIGWGGTVRGVFVFEEQLRESALSMLAECRQRGMNLGILTGDSSNASQRLAATEDLSVAAGLTPEEKKSELEKVQKLIGPVALIGDGINDVVALSAADVGICLGCGADVSRDTADICLVGNDLSQIPWLIDLSRQTLKTIRTNLTWAFGYNGIGMAVAATGYLHPAVAAALMVVSSVFVITNSLRLQSTYSVPENHEEASKTSLRQTEQVTQTTFHAPQSIHEVTS